MSKNYRLNKSIDLFHPKKKTRLSTESNFSPEADFMSLYRNNNSKSKNTTKMKKIAALDKRSKTSYKMYTNSSHEIGSKILKNDIRYNINPDNKDFILATKVDSILGGKLCASENLINHEPSTINNICVKSSNIVGLYPFDFANNSKLIDKIISDATNSTKLKQKSKIEDVKRE